MTLKCACASLEHGCRPAYHLVLPLHEFIADVSFRLIKEKKFFVFKVFSIYFFLIVQGEDLAGLKIFPLQALFH